MLQEVFTRVDGWASSTDILSHGFQNFSIRILQFLVTFVSAFLSTCCSKSFCLQSWLNAFLVFTQRGYNSEGNNCANAC